MVVAISLALPGAMLLTLDNLRPLIPDLEQPAQVSVMLDGELDLEQAEALQRELAAWDSVEDVTLVRRGEALAAFGEQTGCLLYTSPSPRDAHESRMPSSA